MPEQQATAQEVINGVDVGQLTTTIETVKQQPDLAACKFRARNKWVNGGHNQARIQDFYACGEEQTFRTEPFVLEIDEPPLLLGEDHGPNPVEYLLTALSGCVTTTFVYYAAAQGIHIEELECELEGDLDLRGFLGISGEVPSGYQDIRVTFRVKSDAPPEKLEELAKLAERRSPVGETIARPVPLSVAVERM